ncbi:MAG: DnaD domain protein [Lachnospiraceae bacterium]|nr:DnaD domain protein [Lachnospiraceae bacterium]
MSDFTLNHLNIQSVTCIPNAFIDTYLASANGSFIKVYLYLLRHCAVTPADGTGTVLSVSRMADDLENTEADILRALRYWHKEQVLYVAFEQDEATSAMKVTEVTFLPLQTQTQQPEQLPHQPQSEQQTTHDTITPSQSKVIQLPKRHHYTPVEAEVLQRDMEVSSVLTLVETMMGEPLTSPHVQLILYLMSDLDFSSDLVVHLYETSLNNGKKAPRYLETVALNWAKKGIHTVEEAKAESYQFNTKYNIVTKTLGITRQLAPAERAVIDSWDTYHFSEAIIAEACRRTIMQTGDQSLSYAGKILEDWNKKQVHSLADIEKLDADFKNEKKTVGRNASLKNSTPKGSTSKNQFQNFTQRTYSDSDFATLEKQLLRK